PGAAEHRVLGSQGTRRPGSADASRDRSRRGGSFGERRRALSDPGHPLARGEEPRLAAGARARRRLQRRAADPATAGARRLDPGAGPGHSQRTSFPHHAPESRARRDHERERHERSSRPCRRPARKLSGACTSATRVATDSTLRPREGPTPFTGGSPVKHNTAMTESEAAQWGNGMSGGGPVSVGESLDAQPGTESQILVFEQPLNERMRTFLRLDFLYNQALYHNEVSSPWSSRAAVSSLIDILAITVRGDVRSDVLKELESQLTTLNEFQSNPGVDSQRLKTLTSNLARLRTDLMSAGSAFLQPLRDSEFLSAIKLRSGIPGGTCEFDLPDYTFWLAQPDEPRIRSFNQWLG